MYTCARCGEKGSLPILNVPAEKRLCLPCYSALRTAALKGSRIRDMVQPQRRSRYVRNDNTTWAHVPKKPKRRPAPERKRAKPVESVETKPVEEPVPEEDIDTERFKKIELQACVQQQ